MIILGLTGTIGSGKSMVAAQFARAHVPVFDADATVHTLLAPSGAAVAHVLAAFGDVGTAEGGINRQQLGRLVFANPAALAQLENILHPLVGSLRRDFVQQHAYRRTPLIVLDIPLLFETGADISCDLTAVVHTPAHIRRARLHARDGTTSTLAAREARQLPDHAKASRADILIQNGLSRAHTRRQVLAIVEALL